MSTKRQQRADERIRQSKRRKERRFQDFALKVAKRRLKNPEDSGRLMINFCCLPGSLEMSRDEFLSAGQQLIGGAVALFDRGKLRELLPGWRCENRDDPAIMMRTFVEKRFHENGGYRR